MILKRISVYLLLPAGISLLLLPIHTHRREDVRKELLYLQILQTLQSQDAPETVDFPPSDNPIEEDVLGMLEEHREHLSNPRGDDPPVENSDGYRIISDQELAPYLALRDGMRYLESMASLVGQGRYGSTRMEEVPLDEWESFKVSLLQGTEPARFQHGAAVFEGHTETADAREPIEINGLKTGRRILGGIFIALGLAIMPGLYRSRTKEDGIRVGNRRAILLWDIIVIGVGIVFTWWCMDIVITKIFQTDSFWGDDPIKLMGVVWVMLITPFMTLFVSATAAQTVFISGEGITLRGLFGEQALAWSDVEEIRVSELYTPREVGDTVAPKQAARMLRVSGRETTLHVMEPPLVSTKKEILKRLAQFAPEDLQPSIAESSNRWNSTW